MQKKLHVSLALTMLFFLSSSQTQAKTIEINATNAIRILGVVAAIKGILSMPRKDCSPFWATILLVGGSTAALGADKIIKKPTFGDQLSTWGTQLSGIVKNTLEAVTGKRESQH